MKTSLNPMKYTLYPAIGNLCEVSEFKIHYEQLCWDKNINPFSNFNGCAGPVQKTKTYNANYNMQYNTHTGLFSNWWTFSC